MPEDTKRLNPQIHEVEIGTRELRKIKIYPLAAGHQLELSDLISDAVRKFAEMDTGDETESMVAFISFALGMIKDNIDKIIGYLTDDPKGAEILNEITNSQLSEIIGIVYRENFEIPVKNVMSLFQKKEEAMTSAPSMKSSPRSVRRTAIR